MDLSGFQVAISCQALIWISRLSDGPIRLSDGHISPISIRLADGLYQALIIICSYNGHIRLSNSPIRLSGGPIMDISGSQKDLTGSPRPYQALIIIYAHIMDISGSQIALSDFQVALSWTYQALRRT
jgi:hypothetical protein